MELNAAEHLVPVRLEKKPIRDDDVKKDCLRLAQKYLSETAKRFYALIETLIAMTTKTFTPEE